MRTLHICGASNPECVRLALRVNEARQRWDRIILLDDDPALHGSNVLGVDVAGSWRLLEEVDPARSEVVNAVARTARARREAQERLEAFDVRVVGLVHPRVDTLGVDLAPDVIVYENATVAALSAVERSSVVFMGAVVGHGSRVGSHCIVAPGAVINARVLVGSGAYVGTNASILPDVEIGADATIAANSVVMTDIPSGATALGVPAKLLLARDSAPSVQLGGGPS